MLTFEVINELTLKVTCKGSDTLIAKAGAFIAGENAGAKNYSFEKMTGRQYRSGDIRTIDKKSCR